MNNFNFYKEEIKEITKNGGTLALYDGVPAVCGIKDCRECHFNNYNDVCENRMLRWLYEEHIGKPKLSKKERMFCELAETGWIARDTSLFVCSSKPKKVKSLEMWDIKDGSCFKCICYPFFDLKFDFIKREDDEPWAVEDLLKLEVED